MASLMVEKLFPDSVSSNDIKVFWFIFSIYPEIFGSDFNFMDLLRFLGPLFNPRVAGAHQPEV